MGIFRTFSVVFLLNIIDYFLAPVTTILVAKNLSVSDYGLFNWIGTLIGFITTFFTLGLGQYNYRRIPGRQLEEQYHVFGRSLFIELAFSLVGAIGAVIWMRNDLIRNGLILFFFLRLIFVVLNNEMIRFVGFQKRNILKSIVGLIDARVWFLPLIVFATLKMVTLSTVFISMLLGNLVTFVLLVLISDRRLLIGSFRFDLDFCKSSLRVSIPLVLVDLGMYLQEMACRYILKIYTSYESMGLFSFAYSWFSLIFKFGMLFVYILQPHFSESYHAWEKGDRNAAEKFNSQIKLGFRYSLVFLGGVLICFMMNYEDVIVLVGKVQYKDTLTVAWLLAPYPILTFFAYFNQILMVLKGKTRLMPLYYGIAVATNILLNMLLVPRFGYAAAGFVSSVSYFVLAILLSTQTHDPEFRFRLSLRESLELVGFFLALFLANYIGNRLFTSFWLRMVFLVPTCLLSLPLVIRKRDLATARSF